MNIFNKRKYIYILLGNKLITVDAILPITLAIKKQNKDIRIRFLTFEKKTEIEIKKNKIIYKAITEVGKINNLGYINENNTSKYISKFFKFLHIGYILIKIFATRTKIIHFGALESAYLRKIYRIKFLDFYYFESDGWGHNEVMRDFQLLKRYKKQEEPLNKNNFLVGFSKKWPALKINKNLKNLIVLPSRIWPEWDNFLNKVSDKYWKAECKKFNIKNNNKTNILYILGWLGNFDWIKSERSSINLLKNTLEVLNSFYPNFNIFIKPHYITDMNIVSSIIKKNNYENIFVSYLHTGLLGKFCPITISNYYSLAVIDAYYAGSITIEYSDYSKAALKCSNNKSVISKQVSYFINDNNESFKAAIVKALKERESLSRPTIKYNSFKSNKILIEKLTT